MTNTASKTSGKYTQEACPSCQHNYSGTGTCQNHMRDALARVYPKKAEQIRRLWSGSEVIAAFLKLEAK